MTRIWQRM